VTRFRTHARDGGAPKKKSRIDTVKHKAGSEGGHIAFCGPTAAAMTTALGARKMSDC